VEEMFRLKITDAGCEDAKELFQLILAETESRDECIDLPYWLGMRLGEGCCD